MKVRKVKNQMKIKKQGNKVRVPPVQKTIKIKRKPSDIEEESTVSRAIENVKKIFEKKNVKTVDVDAEPKNENPGKITKRRKRFSIRKIKPQNGIVYLGHIPHGFYEDAMAKYFSQFGKVCRVRIARSRKTGKSRGYGYVEFEHPEVAEVAAESMNNYLMCGRLLKATYVPPDKQHTRYFAGKPWSEENYPKLRNRTQHNKKLNARLTNKEHNSSVQSMKDKLSNLERKLKEKGLNIDFISLCKA